jgi:hypothetical protein
MKTKSEVRVQVSCPCNKELCPEGIRRLSPHILDARIIWRRVVAHKPIAFKGEKKIFSALKTMNDTGKGKISPVTKHHAMKVYKGHVFLISALNKGVWSVSSSNHCTLRERALHTH